MGFEQQLSDHSGSADHSNDEKDQKGRYVRRETFSGSCARSFYVGDVEDIHAKFEDGVLHSAACSSDEGFA